MDSEQDRDLSQPETEQLAEKKPYQPPEVVHSATLEGLAATCTVGGKSPADIACASLPNFS